LRGLLFYVNLENRRTSFIEIDKDTNSYLENENLVCKLINIILHIV